MAFEKTQEELNTLRNLTWQNGKLIEQVEKLTKMLEEKEDSALIADIEEAKRVLAEAINTKGGNSVGDESFAKLAEDIRQLPESGILASGIEHAAPFDFLSCYLNDSYPVVKIKDTITKQANVTIGSFSNITDAEFDVLEIINVTFFMKKGNTLVAPKLKSYKAFVAPETAVNIVLGTLESAPSITYVPAHFLRNITIGQDTDIDLPFNTWAATNVIAEGQSGIDELNNNLRTNLLEKLYDHSTDGETRTMRLGWLAHVTQENIDYANSKGWTLTT